MLVHQVERQHSKLYKTLLQRRASAKSLALRPAPHGDVLQLYARRSGCSQGSERYREAVIAFFALFATADIVIQDSTE